MADSFNELFGLGSHSADAALEGWWPMQDDAASTTVVDQSGNGITGTLIGGDNTADISATGPNSWLAKALHLNGSDDAVSLGNDRFESDTTGTFFAFVRFDSFPTISPIFSARRSNGDLFHLYVPSSVGAFTVQDFQVSVKNNAYSGGTSLSVDTWYPVSLRSNGTTWTIRLNGSNETLTGLAGSNTGDWFGDLPAAVHAFHLGRGATAGTSHLDGYMAGPVNFGRWLSDAEVDEISAGPEPVNTVAPVLSGAESVGASLSATSGTWGLDSPFSGGSNGTITYAYQWTRSNDGSGTGEADISGATSSSYTLVEDDLGKFIRCRVRASNDGGFDADADTSSGFSGEITVSRRGAALLMQMIGA